MKIAFYEEFPDKESLRKLKLIKFPAKIFIAAKSVEEFKELERIARNYKENLKVAYWPILKNSYWISPFSNRKDLTNLFNEIEKIKNPLLIDLELPLKRSLILRNFFKFKKNKKIIGAFLEQNKERITTAEYPLTFISKFMKIFGLNYNLNYERSIMWYSSMFPSWLNKRIKESIQKIKNKDNYSISLGTIATGILGDESILSPKNLEKDLEFVENCGFNKAIIFRLEGLNKKYVDVLKKFN